MEIILLIGIIILLGLVLKLQSMTETMSKKNEEMNQLHALINSQQKSIDSLNQNSLKSIEKEETIAERLRNMNQNVQDLLKESTISSGKVEDIASKVISLNNIMINKKARGNWGEYQLNNLLSVYAGDNQEIFEIQYSLKSGSIGDVALHLPGTEKVMIIDSKFPLENYQNMINDNFSELEKANFEKEFKLNIKKHINDISQKYITSETVENAVMFIPSEAIYMYLCGYCSELIEIAHKKHVLITCPTTLIGIVFTLVNATKDFKRSKNIKSLEKDIVKMYDDVGRLYSRLDKVDKNINTLQNSFAEVKTSSKLIGNKIIKIHDGYVPEDDEE